MTQTLYGNHFSPRFWLDWITHTDSAIIVQQNSTKPTAFMNGTADRFVPPNIHYQAWVDHVNRPNATFKLFDDIDHSFGTEYDSTMSPEVLQFMISWIHENTQNCGIVGFEEQTPPHPTLSLYPNPTTEKLTIISTQTNGTHCQLIDNQGEILRSIPIENSSTKLDISDLKNGIYFITCGAVLSKFIKN